jgi:hypothetical protein
MVVELIKSETGVAAYALRKTTNRAVRARVFVLTAQRAALKDSVRKHLAVQLAVSVLRAKLATTAKTAPVLRLELVSNAALDPSNLFRDHTRPNVCNARLARQGLFALAAPACRKGRVNVAKLAHSSQELVIGTVFVKHCPCAELVKCELVTRVKLKGCASHAKMGRIISLTMRY